MRLLRETILSVAEAPAPAPAVLAHPVGWHSPVPYLFGGLAAMLGLIAFALLILACSYWKLSGYPSDEASDADADAGDGEKVGQKESGWENNVLVIMAGQVIPTFLATPSTSRSSSFGDTASNSSGGSASTAENCEGEKGEKVAVQLSSESVSDVAGAGDVEERQHHHSAV